MRNANLTGRGTGQRFATAVALILAAVAARAQQEHHAPPGPADYADHAAHTADQDAHAAHSEHAMPAAGGVPAITDADRAAAFPDLGDMQMSGMMIESPLNKLVLLDELETGRADGADLLTWNLDAWVGRDLSKLWLRTEGERHGSDTERAELEIFWGKSLARWWDVLAGARADFAPGDERNWAAIGVHGLAPYRFEVEATAYVRSGGQTAFRVETAYEVLVTNRLILEPSLEINWYGRADTARAIGSGLADAELGLRLRYEIRREIAPYVGLVRERTFGGTADFARAAGIDDDDTRLVAGIRLWF